jgi:hypothetical protein
MCVLIFSTTFCLKHFSLQGVFSEILSQMYTSLHVSYPLSFSDSNKLEFSQQIFEIYTNIKFHKNPFSGTRVVLCGGTDRETDRQTEMTKLIFASRNFANKPKNSFLRHTKHTVSILTRPVRQSC